jgi:catabolite repression HPr-like protein
MGRKRLTISSDEGLQSQAAALLVQVAGRFESGVWIEQGNKRVNAKSIMGVLSLRLRKGDSFTIVASGADEETAVAAITRLIETGEAKA